MQRNGRARRFKRLRIFRRILRTSGMAWLMGWSSLEMTWEMRMRRAERSRDMKTTTEMDRQIE